MTEAVDPERSANAARRVVWGVGTSRTVRAHWALAELRLAYTTEVVRTRTPDTQSEAFTRLNPHGKIPVMRDGDVTITESAAIVTYLAETYGSSDSLWMPVQAGLRAQYFEWLSFICMELDATSLYVLRRHRYLPEIYGDAPAANEAAAAYFTRMARSAARLVREDARYLLGEHFSGVDILMTTCLEWALDYHLPLPDRLDVYRRRVVARPGYQQALEANRVP